MTGQATPHAQSRPKPHSERARRQAEAVQRRLEQQQPQQPATAGDAGALAQAMRWAESEASDKAVAEVEEDPIKRNQRLLREDAERKAREREEIRLRILDDKCA